MSETLSFGDEEFAVGDEYLQQWGMEIRPEPGTSIADPLDKRYDLQSVLRMSEAQYDIPPDGMYISCFGGEIPPDLDPELMSELFYWDRETVKELSQMPGFINYTTVVDKNGKTMSLCFWASARTAREGVNKSEAHKSARELLETCYAPGSVSFHRRLLAPSDNPAGYELITVSSSAQKPTE